MDLRKDGLALLSAKDGDVERGGEEFFQNERAQATACLQVLSTTAIIARKEDHLRLQGQRSSPGRSWSIF